VKCGGMLLGLRLKALRFYLRDHQRRHEELGEAEREKRKCFSFVNKCKIFFVRYLYLL
jgi:hypothetical protein